MNGTRTKFIMEGTTIPTPVTLSEAGRRLGRNPHWIKGACEVLGITLLAVGNALQMTAEDFDRLKAESERIREAAGAVA